MATTKLSQSNPKPEPKATYEYGLTESQLRVLSNIADAVDGLASTMTYEQPGGGNTNLERQVFADMAQGIWGAISRLSGDIERQKLGGGQVGRRDSSPRGERGAA